MPVGSRHIRDFFEKKPMKQGDANVSKDLVETQVEIPLNAPEVERIRTNNAFVWKPGNYPPEVGNFCLKVVR